MQLFEDGRNMCLDIITENGTSLNCNTSGVLEDTQTMHKAVKLIVLIIFICLGVIGLFGNFFIIIILTIKPDKKKPSNLLIINLSVTYLLLALIFASFTSVKYIMPIWLFGNVWCKIINYFMLVILHTSAYTFVLISFDGFMCVLLPIMSISFRSKKNTIRSIIMMWTVFSALAVPVSFCFEAQEYIYQNSTHSTCVFIENSKLEFYIALLITSYVIPLGLMMVMYSMMLVKLWKDVPGVTLSAERRQGRHNVTCMVMAMVSMFAVCLLPIHILLITKASDEMKTTNISRTMQILSHILAYSNGCISPFPYTFLSKNFKDAIQKFLTKEPPKNIALVERREPTKAIEMCIVNDDGRE